jgi:hypothetical protein
LKVFNKNYVRIPIRIIALGVALTLACYYFALLYGFNREFQRFPGFGGSANIASKVYLYFNIVIYRSGLPPMISAVYFLVICRAPQSNLWGLLIVGLSIFPVHLIVFHWPNPILQIIQLLLTFYPIAYWKRKRMDDKFLQESEKMVRVFS